MVSWEFTSLDPTTLQPTEDPLAGFLPPNVNKPEGEGAVMFTIRTLNSVSNDTQIKNKAYIYFDTNDPIITNEWLNTADLVKPQSQVNALPSTQNSTNIELTWSGTDTGSGIKSYSIYYSVNGEPFEILVSNTTATSYTFVGNVDTTYSFFSVATDNVGNFENKKLNGDTSISLGIKNNELFNSVSLYPNPNKGNFNLSINSTANGDYDVSISDALGRMIYKQKQKLQLGNNVVSLNVGQSGIYFVTISDTKRKTTKKVIVNK